MDTQTSQSSAAVEFTYSWYGAFLDRIADAGYEFRRFTDRVGEGDVIFRHDVDLSLEDAVTMARLEADRGVASTYCFLLTSPLYNLLEGANRERLREIGSLGHEIALHFSTHEYWADEPPDDDALAHRVGQERVVLDGLVHDVTGTVSFHSPPEWVLNRSFGGLRSTYASAYFDEMTYVADSGQRWRMSPPDVDAFGDSAQVLAHPGLYGEHDGTFEERVERAVTHSCRHANAKAQREFVAGDR